MKWDDEQTKRFLSRLLFLGLVALMAFLSHHSIGATRTEQAASEVARLFEGRTNFVTQTAPEFAQIRDNLIYADIPNLTPNISQEKRFLIQIVTAVVNQSFNTLERYTLSALKNGTLVNYIEEAVFQTAPYIGLDKTEEALFKVNLIIQLNHAHVPLLPQTKVTDENRFEKGKEIQKKVLGNTLEKIRPNTAPPSQKTLFDLETAYLYGDFYSRGAIDLKTRELLQFVTVVALGNADSHIKMHIQGSLNVGNTKNDLTEVLMVMLPHIGFPRTMHALDLLNNF